jgi:hypothetical protein
LGTDPNIVLDELKLAFNSGFTEITHAKSDPDFASVRESEPFKELTQMRFGYDVDWNALTPDILIVSNQSEFDWTNVIIKVNFIENHSQGWKTIMGDDGIRKERLNRGESFSFEAFNSTKNLLISVQPIFILSRVDKCRISKCLRSTTMSEMEIDNFIELKRKLLIEEAHGKT